ncbi:uncharacterized protein LOC144576500 isoform X3 [Callithrix jacchus]
MMKLLEEQQKNEGFLKSERTSSAQQPWCWYRSYRQEKAKIMAAALRQPLLLAATHPRRACCEHLSSLGLCFLRRWLREYHRFLLAPRVQDFTADESGNVGAKGSCLPFPSHIPTVKNRSWPENKPSHHHQAALRRQAEAQAHTIGALERALYFGENAARQLEGRRNCLDE